MSQELGRKIEESLRKKDMTQKELAHKAGVTEAAVSHYVNGDREPRSATLAAIAGVLGVSAGFLLGMGVESVATKGKGRGFDEIRRLIQENAASFSAEQKVELIRLLSS